MYQNFIEEDNIPVAQLFPKYDIQQSKRACIDG